MSPFNPRRPETQRDLHRPPGHRRPREATSQEVQLGSEVAHGGSKGVKRQINEKLGVPGSADRTDKSAGESLRDTVQAMLDRDENLGGYALEVDVVEGIARVSGIVDTLAEKQHAAELVSGVQGIIGLEDGISLSTDGEITDRGVEMEVAEELAASPNLAEKVGAKVSGGIAYLMGRVDSKEEEDQAIGAASKARGVTSVVSQIKIGGRDVVNPDDSEELFHSQVRNDADSRRDE